MTEPFLFIELQDDALTDGRAFDGVAFGTFNDMLGREITLEPDDAADYAANTQAAIDATTTESGELVGLPIDAQGHDKGDGAGWIVGVELVEGVIRLVPKWTEIGRELISKGIRRFFSATIDVSNKVVLGGTLTNWPATRDENNRVMLRPIELESKLQTVQELELADAAPLVESKGGTMPEDTNVEKVEDVTTDPVVATPPAEPADPPADPVVTAELVQEFANAGGREPADLALAVQKRSERIAANRVQEMMEQREQEWQITNLAAHYTGGAKYGLPVSIGELTSFMSSLNPDQFRVASELFTTITDNGLIEFQEIGHGRRLLKQPLPEVYHANLRRTLEAGNSVAQFFELAGLGDPGKYDLSQFEGGK
jgi:hypothetical protein